MPKSDLQTATPGRPRDKSLDETLIRITLELLSQTGLESVTMAKIGRLSGIPATSIYRRYPDARSLIIAALEHDLARMPTTLPDHGSLRDDLMAYLRLISEALAPERARLLAGMILPMHKDPVLAEMLARKLETLRVEAWQGLLARAVARGTLSAAALGAEPLDDAAQTMVFYQAVVRFKPVDEPFLNRLLDNVLLPALERFRIA